MAFSIIPLGLRQEHLIPQYAIQPLEERINQLFPLEQNDDDIDIVYTNDIEFNNIYESNDYWNLYLRYQHPSYGKQMIERRHVYIDDFNAQCHQIAQFYWQQQNCSHDESSIQRATYNGRPYPDGKAMCQDCDLILPEYFPTLNNGTKVISGLLDGTYVTQYDWGDTSIQKGNNGVVICQDRDNYQTAFFEAFPSINGINTFIRGEGQSVEHAESECWKKYEKQSRCSEHEFTRWQGKQYRKDGFGTCIHCGFRSSQALDPETLCCICSTPTNRKLNGDFYCTYHYFEQPFSFHQKDVLDAKTIFPQDEINQSKKTMEAYIEHYLKKSYLDQYGVDAYNAQESRLERISWHFSKLFCKHVYDLNPLDDDMTTCFADENNPLLNQMLAFCSGNIDRIIRLSDLKADIPSMLFFSFDIYHNTQ